MQRRLTWWVLIAGLVWARPAFADRWDRAWDKATRTGVEAKYEGKLAPAEAQFQTALQLADTHGDQADPRVVQSLDNLAGLYLDLGRHAEAETLYTRALHLRKTHLGANHADVAVGLMNLGWLYDVQGSRAHAEQFYTEALAIREEALGEKHPDVAATLMALGDLYSAQDRFEESIDVYGRAGNIAAHTLGASHLRVADAVGRLAWVRTLQQRSEDADTLFEKAITLYHATTADPADVAVSLHLLAGLYQEREHFPQAQRLYAWALKIMEQNVGPTHESLGTSLNNLAALHYAQGEYDEAEALYARALDIAERSQGPDHLATATALHNLASLYHAQARYREAAQLYDRALRIREASLGRDNLQVAETADNLAALYTAEGRYARAEPLYTRALKIRETQLGPDHPDVATSLNNLGSLHHTMGELDRAHPLYARALAITEQRLGPDHLGVAAALNNIAGVAFLRKDYAVAEQRYRRSLAIREQALGSHHPAVATALNNLGALHEVQAQYAKAEALYRRALAIQEATLGRSHPALGITLNNLARLHHSRGDYAAAEPLFLRAVDIAAASQGERHPAYARARHNAGVMYGNWGRPEAALKQQVAGLGAVTSILEDLALWAAEPRLNGYLTTLEYRYDQFYSLLAQHPAAAARVANQALEAHLAYKGLAAETVARRNRLALLGDDPALAKQMGQLRAVTQRLATVTLAGPGEGSPEEHQATIKALEQEKADVEAKLARTSAAYAAAQFTDGVTVESVAAALPPSGLYLDLVLYDTYDFAKTGWTGEQRYLAFALRRDTDGRPVVQIEDLGPADTIDGIISRLREALQAEAETTRGIGGARQLRPTPTGPGASEFSLRLSEKVLQPFADALAHTRLLCVAPGGNFNLLPFEILSAPRSEELIADRMFVAYALGRDLHAARTARTPDEGDPNFYVFAAPDFAPHKRGRAGTAPADTSPVLKRGVVRGWPITFEPLPGTRAEAKGIAKAAGRRRVTTYLGRSATEERFKALRRPAQVHIATHGFFLEDVARPTPRDVRGIGGARPVQGAVAETAQGLGGLIELRNPLLRSGLALAGFNGLAEGVDPGQGRDDGILTALEVTWMDLQGTELVVLSACDTGLGEVQRGQGVAGLRRSFRIAGARNVLMSLWSVPDEETAWLMEEFHRRHLGGEPPLMALHGARQVVRKRLIERDGTDHPFFWAAFVLQSASLS